MWISPPTPVTTRIITADSGSSWNATSACRVPTVDPGEHAVEQQALVRLEADAAGRTPYTDERERQPAPARRRCTLIARLPDRLLDARAAEAVDRPRRSAAAARSSADSRRCDRDSDRDARWSRCSPLDVAALRLRLSAAERVRRLDVDGLEASGRCRARSPGRSPPRRRRA